MLILINLLFYLYSSKTRFGRPTLQTRRRRFSFSSRCFLRVENDESHRLNSQIKLCFYKLIYYFVYIAAKHVFGRPTLLTRRRRFSFNSRCFVLVENDKIPRLYRQINLCLYYLNYYSVYIAAKHVSAVLHYQQDVGASVLIVGVSYVWKMTKFVVFIAKEDTGKAVLSVYIAAKHVLAVLHNYQDEGASV